MRFAINFSPQAEALWREGAIQVDLFKCPDWSHLVARVEKIHAVYIHTSLNAGRGADSRLDLDLMRHWLDSTETLVVNTHLWALRSDFPAAPTLSAEAIVARAVKDLRALGDRFGMDKIVVENVPYPTRWAYGDLLAELVDPALITEIVERSGCGFLLDTAHAIRACEGLDHDVRAYISALPLHALRELHIVGIDPRPDELGIRRDHLPMTDADWEIAEWAIDQIRAGRWRVPDTLAFEYGGIGEKFEWRSEASVIARQAPRLYRLAKSVG